MDILEEYKNEPICKLKVELDNDYHLIIKWNTFRDKKDGLKPILRPRYILFDSKGERQSLKTLNLTTDVEFKQIYLTDKEIYNLTNAVEDGVQFVEMLIGIAYNYSSWLKNDFTKMIESGGVKIKSFVNINNKL